MKTFILALIVAVIPSAVQARQYPTANGRVVHTRRAPVVVHRILPPFAGVHVYEGGPRR